MWLERKKPVPRRRGIVGSWEKGSEKILDELARPFEIDHAPVFVNASVGIVVWPEDGATTSVRPSRPGILPSGSKPEIIDKQ